MPTSTGFALLPPEAEPGTTDRSPLPPERVGVKALELQVLAAFNLQLQLQLSSDPRFFETVVSRVLVGRKMSHLTYVKWDK